MGQLWYLLNIDSKEMGSDGGHELGEFFFGNFIHLLRRIKLPCFPKEAEKWLTEGRMAMQPGPFGKLSTELIDMIFEGVWINDFFDVVVLSATCKLLLHVGKRHIIEGLRQIHGRWTYGRIICMGEYTMQGDKLPAGMLTDAEQREMETAYGVDISRIRFLTFAFGTYQEDRKAYTDFYAWTEARGRTIRHPYRSPPNPVAEHDRKVFDILVCWAYIKPSYPEGPMALYNLCKGEYVREDALTALTLQDGQYKMNLAHALLSRICWSPDPSISMVCEKKYEKALTMGPWAGDRFCVTGVDEKPRLRKGKEWKDVTEDVYRMLHHLWKHNTVGGMPDMSDEDRKTNKDGEKGGDDEREMENQSDVDENAQMNGR